MAIKIVPQNDDERIKAQNSQFQPHNKYFKKLITIIPGFYRSIHNIRRPIWALVLKISERSRNYLTELFNNEYDGDQGQIYHVRSSLSSFLMSPFSYGVLWKFIPLKFHMAQHVWNPFLYF